MTLPDPAAFPVRGAMFVGPGRMGLALAEAHALSGCVARVMVRGRRAEPPDHPLFGREAVEYGPGLAAPPNEVGVVWLTVPDRALEGVANELADRGAPTAGCVALHVSGVLDVEVLASLRGAGYAVGSAHPLWAAPGREPGVRDVRSAHFSLVGDPEALSVARALLGCLGANELEVPGAGRPLYHAAATLVATAVPVALARARDLLVRAGADPDASLAALVGLARSAVTNVATSGPVDAATGALRRGDEGTVRTHLELLDGGDRELYRTVQRSALDLLSERLDPDQIDRVRALLAEPEVTET